MKDRSRLVIQLSVLSRIFTIALGILASTGMTEGGQRNSIVFGSHLSTGLIYRLLSPFVQWDGNHFLNIALRGYDSILSHAFFPGLPLAIRMFGTPLTMLGVPVEYAFALGGIMFVNLCFVLGALGLYKFSSYYLSDPEAGFRVSLFYIFTSANIFMSALYTESPFTMFTFWGKYYLFVRGNFWISGLLFGFGGLFRSNGILAVMFLMFHGLNSRRLIPAVIGSAISLCPYILYSIWSKNIFCVDDPLDWCATKSIYAFIQDTFWDVGFLKYWTLQHSGQILLMIPSLLVAGVCVFQWVYRTLSAVLIKRSERIIWGVVSRSESWRMLPFVAQIGILTLFTVLFANCQILTRLLTSCPIYFWTLERITRINSLLAYIHLAYFMVGPVVFTSGWNWT
jgi:GPI mannosyltransferase 2